MQKSNNYWPYLLGLASGIYAALANYYAYESGLHRTGAIKAWQLSAYIILAAAIFIAIYLVKKSKDGRITFMRSMFTGIVVSIVAGLSSGLGNSLYMNIINPQIKSEIMVISEQMIVQQKDSSAQSFSDYEQLIIQSFDSITMTAEERLSLPAQAARDSTADMRIALQRVEKGFATSQMMIGQTMVSLIIGVVLSLIAAAIMVNQRGQ